MNANRLIVVIGAALLVAVMVVWLLRNNVTHEAAGVELTNGDAPGVKRRKAG